MIRFMEYSSQKIKLIMEPLLLNESLFTKKEIEQIVRLNTTKLIKMDGSLFIYNVDKKAEIHFRKTQIHGHTHFIEVSSISPKELFINKGLLTHRPNTCL